MVVGGLKRGNNSVKIRGKRQICRNRAVKVRHLWGVAIGSKATLLGGHTLRALDPIDPSHHQQVRPPAQIIHFYFRIAYVSRGIYDDNHCTMTYL